jgi:hypothetical protein
MVRHAGSNAVATIAISRRDDFNGVMVMLFEKYYTACAGKR